MQIYQQNYVSWIFVFKDAKDVFKIVVTVEIQSVFDLEINQNEVFFIFKKLFLTSANQNDPKK